MSVIVSSIKLTLSENENVAIEKAIALLGVKKSEIRDYCISKVSLDARAHNVKFVYSVTFNLNINEKNLVLKKNSPQIRYKENNKLKIENNRTFSKPPVVVGFGPAGMFCALILARCGCSPIVLERGDNVDNRVKSVENFWRNGVLDVCTNVQFGEGGAGTFSDGKLTTRINDERCDYVLNALVSFGAPDEILYKSKPHIGTDNLRSIVKSIRNEIEKLGGKVLFLTKLEDVEFKNNKVVAVKTNKGTIETEDVVLAIGHSARDTFEMLLSKGILIEPKPFSVGIRVEHLQENINRGLYGKYADSPKLPKGEYQLSHIENGRGVYTFCMCPGGQVVAAASEEDTVVVNGMSQFSRNGENANSAVVVNVDSRDFENGPLGGMYFQRKLENLAFKEGGAKYKAPCQTLDCFLEGKTGANFSKVVPTYPIGVKESNFETVLPKHVVDMLKIGFKQFDKKISGFASSDTVLTGVETRTSSPVRITRNEKFCAVGFNGLYPCAEGAGYAGGIMSAAVDGIRVAQSILKGV